MTPSIAGIRFQSALQSSIRAHSSAEEECFPSEVSGRSPKAYDESHTAIMTSLAFPDRSVFRVDSIIPIRILLLFPRHNGGNPVL